MEVVVEGWTVVVSRIIFPVMGPLRMIEVIMVWRTASSLTWVLGGQLA